MFFMPKLFNTLDYVRHMHETWCPSFSALSFGVYLFTGAILALEPPGLLSCDSISDTGMRCY